MAKIKILKQTPASLGYSFPPEWGPHEGTWFSWPRPEGISFPGKYDTVPENMARIFREISPREKVHVNVPNASHERLVKEQLTEHGCSLRNIVYHHVKTNECWCRDHGPAFVKSGRSLAIVDWKFNAYGGKYPSYKDDDAVPTQVAEELGLPVFYPGIVMEGGAVDFNGAGTVLTTTDCLLNKNRNPRLSKSRIEKYLKDYYGQKKVCWLTGAVAGDDTDGHVDDLARFIGPRKIAIALEADGKDANYSVLRDARRQLEHLTDQAGRAFEIVEIPMPAAVVHKGRRLPATYVNFYFVNGALLVPTYRDRRNDRKALGILQSHLPRRKVIGIDCVELIWGLGAIHCLSQQQPKG
jgi:agmatine deiminase